MFFSMYTFGITMLLWNVMLNSFHFGWKPLRCQEHSPHLLVHRSRRGVESGATFGGTHWILPSFQGDADKHVRKWGTNDSRVPNVLVRTQDFFLFRNQTYDFEMQPSPVNFCKYTWFPIIALRSNASNGGWATTIQQLPSGIMPTAIAKSSKKSTRVNFRVGEAKQRLPQQSTMWMVLAVRGIKGPPIFAELRLLSSNCRF